MYFSGHDPLRAMLVDIEDAVICEEDPEKLATVYEQLRGLLPPCTGSQCCQRNRSQNESVLQQSVTKLCVRCDSYLLKQKKRWCRLQDVNLLDAKGSAIKKRNNTGHHKLK